MYQNFFTFAGDFHTELTFLFWCLCWHQTQLEPENKLSYMAKDILALMGEDDLPDEQGIGLSRRAWDGFEYIIVNLQGLNRVLVIGDMMGSMSYDEKQEECRKQVLCYKKTMKIDESVTIRTVLFHTYYAIDSVASYRNAAVDYKIDKASLLSVLGKYENINKSLDLYIESLRERISIDEDEGRYTNIMPLENPLNWNICNSYIAQYNFMHDMFYEHYPKALCEQKSELYIIQQGIDPEGRYPWSEFSFAKGVYPVSKINYSLYWHLQAVENGPRMALQMFEWDDDHEDAVYFGEADKALKQMMEEDSFWHMDLRCDWSGSKDDVGKTNKDALLGCRTSTILSISLEKLLKDWDSEADKLRHDLLLSTDYFLEEIPKTMETLKG